MSNGNLLIPCKFCKGEPKHGMIKDVYHRYICACLHRTYTDEMTQLGAARQWHKQNIWGVM